MKCIVVDEVDRLVDVLSKHAPAREAEKRKRHARPIAALLERVLSANGEAQVGGERELAAARHVQSGVLMLCLHFALRGA